jgi:diguanylate cyclase (GGDEF)-like protein
MTARAAGTGTGSPAWSPWAGALVEVAVAGIAAVVAGAVMVTGCGGPVCTPVAAAGASFASGFVIASVQWRAWARARVGRALRDPLTGLATRAVMEARLDDATRTGEPVTVALADVDGLHAVNANFGHAAGDRYLSAVAYRLARAVPAGGCLVRQGGDEFTIVVPGTDAQALAAAIGAAMAGPAVIAGHRLQPRASVGIATSDGHGQSGGLGGGDARHVRARADVAMYAAKEAGGNHIRVWDPVVHGEPDADGTRPLRRRRDIDPSAGRAPWQPDPGDGLIPVLLVPTEARLVHRALALARDLAAGGHRGDYSRLVTRLGPLLDPNQVDPDTTGAGGIEPDGIDARGPS